ncbi:TlpA family protein disulfide reductase [Alicyclobacillus sp. ALC3]|uniref:TlpA family protein disulfide reductase n=1 Tax=Alicyclobacillus sp. ALC3 TaxID=2796143 RepID=UPI002379621A|nr:TlpA disulfide reductase family protein [Alicyclobacillus sp. ALC3]WDL95366.1 TlpA family protein disulfide reductase [Alicyclobacillus sp. ALC3]
MNLGLKWSMIGAGVTVLLLTVLTPHPKASAPIATNPSAITHPFEGYSAPPFTLTQLSNGQSVSLAQYAGKPIFINFWASWCPPCRAETPDIVQAYRKYGNKVSFISVNLTNQDTLPNVQAFVKKFGIQYPVLLDKTAAASNLYDVIAIPTSFFINRKGLIVARFSGAIPHAELTSMLNRIENS